MQIYYRKDEYYMDYIGNLRQYIGTQPIIMCGACVIIVNEKNEILMHHRTDRDWWGLPGGAMELKENLEDTARREVFEEINLVCEDLQLLNVYSGAELYYKYPDGNEVYNVTVAYVCKKFTGEIIVEKTEGRSARFFNMNELPSNISNPIRPILKDYIEKNNCK
jgi:ADP-ribose pyrophosphatase YjhB (NUDIX family)